MLALRLPPRWKLSLRLTPITSITSIIRGTHIAFSQGTEEVAKKQNYSGLRRITALLFLLL